MVAELAPAMPRPHFPTNSPATFLLVVVVSPALETLMMAGWIDLLRRWLGAVAAVVASAASWGVLHSLMAPAWGLVIWWPFLVFSVAYVTWRRDLGFWRAVALVTCIHALQNLTPALVLLTAE
jgi:hypothetical protein